MAVLTKKNPLLLLMLGLLFCGPALGAEVGFPAPRGAVNDFAGVIDAASVQTMENVSREVLEKTGTSIVVAVLAEIGDNSPDDYANRLYQAWGIGVKGKDRGVLIFLALKERKVRIETGYGVEGILPDGLTGEILDNYVLPDLKAGQYGQGLTKGVFALASVIAKDAGLVLTGAPPLSVPRETAASRPGINLFTVILIVIALVLLIGTRPGRELLPYLIMMLMSGGGRGGGSGGFGGGGFGGFGGGFSGGGGSSRDF